MEHTHEEYIKLVKELRTMGMSTHNAIIKATQLLYIEN